MDKFTYLKNNAPLIFLIILGWVIFIPTTNYQVNKVNNLKEEMADIYSNGTTENRLVTDDVIINGNYMVYSKGKNKYLAKMWEGKVETYRSISEKDYLMLRLVLENSEERNNTALKSSDILMEKILNPKTN